MSKTGRKKKQTAAAFLAAGLLGISIMAGLPSETFAAQSAAAEPQSAAQSVPAASDDETAPASSDIVTTNGIPGWPQGSDIVSESACLMDLESGAVLYDKDMNARLYPASITKLMTVLLTLENGSPDDTVTMTKEGVYWVQPDSSSLYTQVGEQFTVEQLLYGTLIKSANDMATQLGVYVGGSVEQCAEMMNAKAEELGCKNTHFVNACGMHDENHYTCARDMALIGCADVQYEEFRKIIGTVEYTIPATNLYPYARTFDTHCKLLGDADYYYDGIIGGKTGYTDEAGNTLVTFAERNGRTLVCATLMGHGVGDTAEDHISLLNYGFDQFEDLTLSDSQYSAGSDGGIATVPKGVTEEDLEIRTSEPDDSGLVRENFYYEGQEVGHVTMTAENAETAARNRENKEESEREEAIQTLKTSLEAEEPEMPFGIMDYLKANKATVVILLLGAAVAAGFIAIIVLTVKGEHRNH